jgi:hypothetical protein
MDPLLELEDLKGYHINDTHTIISSLAFADDFLLLADSRKKVQDLLYHTKQYLHTLGVKIAARKCATFEVVTAKDSWCVVNPNLHLGKDEYIPRYQQMAPFTTWEATFPPG